MAAELEAMLKPLYETNFTKKTYRAPYPAVSPTRPELNQAGRVVLITGGSSGVGFSTARAFVQASADTVIIIGRRADALTSAASRLEEEAKTKGTNTKIITRSIDVVNQVQVEELWKELADKGIVVDVFAANVAVGTEAKSILEQGTNSTEKFCSQPGEKQKFIINTSTQAIHMTGHPGVAERPAYTLSKMAGTMLFQVIALNTPPEKVQIINYHPGLIYNDAWKAMQLPPEVLDNLFDNDELCGNFAVWATSKEAAFLHGRFVWAAWDVEELATSEVRKRIDEDPYYLRCSIVGLNGELKA